METLLTVYDLDRNGQLSEEEGVKAAPRFARFIESASPLGNYMVEDIFLYLVFRGEQPSSAWQLLTFKAGRLGNQLLNRTALRLSSRFGALDEVDRLGVLKILMVVKSGVGTGCGKN